MKKSIRNSILFSASLMLSQQGALASTFGEVELRGSTAATYVASSGQITPVASTGVMFSLFGSGTKKTYINRVIIWGISSTNTYSAAPCYMNKVSSAYTGGTSAAITVVPTDATFAAGTATPKSWTANPTGGGALVGQVVAHPCPIFYTGVATGHSMQTILYDAKETGAPLVLNSATEGVGITFNGTVPPGSATVTCTFEYTEK